MSYETSRIVKILQEGLGGIRDILINGSQSIYCEIYTQSDLMLRQAQASSAFVAVSPRYVMEALGMLVIIFLAYLLTKDSKGVVTAIPLLGALALGAQKLLPIMQQAYAAWSSISGSKKFLQDILHYLDQPIPENHNSNNLSKISFNHSILLKGISFNYNQNSEQVLSNNNLRIEKGSRVGFVGETGSGKSTLLDIVMGLLIPTKGVVEIDGVVINSSNKQQWQNHIAHVPQFIFLTDSSIESNIAFGVPENQIDFALVRNVARLAQLDATIEKLPMKYKAIVGERGVKLSGGQRQRIGIARALYKNADVLIFDEATSSLDDKTEKAVMDEINKLSKKMTILIIAHRLSTLDKCDTVVEINSGMLNILR